MNNRPYIFSSLSIACVFCGAFVIGASLVGCESKSVDESVGTAWSNPITGKVIRLPDGWSVKSNSNAQKNNEMISAVFVNRNEASVTVMSLPFSTGFDDPVLKAIPWETYIEMWRDGLKSGSSRDYRIVSNTERWEDGGISYARFNANFVEEGNSYFYTGKAATRDKKNYLVTTAICKTNDSPACKDATSLVDKFILSTYRP